MLIKAFVLTFQLGFSRASRIYCKDLTFNMQTAVLLRRKYGWVDSNTLLYNKYFEGVVIGSALHASENFMAENPAEFISFHKSNSN